MSPIGFALVLRTGGAAIYSGAISALGGGMAESGESGASPGAGEGGERRVADAGGAGRPGDAVRADGAEWVRVPGIAMGARRTCNWLAAFSACSGGERKLSGFIQGHKAAVCTKSDKANATRITGILRTLPLPLADSYRWIMDLWRTGSGESCAEVYV